MADLYETDPYAWSLDQADALRAMARGERRAGLDLPHLIEELDAMAGADRRAVESLVAQIIEHLLLLQLMPTADARRHWQVEVVAFRDQLGARLTASLRQHLDASVDRVWRRARQALASKLAVMGEEEVAARLPGEMPYSVEQVLAMEWWPEVASNEPLAKPEATP